MNQDLNAEIPPRPAFPQGDAELLLGSPGSPLDRLERAVANAEAKLGELRAALEERTRQTTELERHLSVAEARLAIETMHSAGLAAQATRLMTVAVGGGAEALAELVGEGGHPGQLGQVYADAFDAKGAELGIEDPQRFRAA